MKLSVAFKNISKEIVIKCLAWISDETYVKIWYYYRTRKYLRLKNPQKFTEKLQWLKLNDHNPTYTQLVDKYEVRKFVLDRVGEEYLIPLIGVYDTFDEIDFSIFPSQFVLKCNHDSGSIVICKDKSNFNVDQARKKLNKALKRSHYPVSREWMYKNVNPRIIAEQYIEEKSGQIKDYKIYCFNGESKLIYVNFDRFVNTKGNLYTTEWEYISATLIFEPDPDYVIKKPNNINLLLQIAEKLAKGFLFMRVDMYCVNEKVYFGEMSFYPGGGGYRIQPEEFDYEMGSWIKLPKN